MLEFALVVSIVLAFVFWGDLDVANYCDKCKMAHLSFSPHCEIEKPA